MLCSACDFEVNLLKLNDLYCYNCKSLLIDDLVCELKDSLDTIKSMLKLELMKNLTIYNSLRDELNAVKILNFKRDKLMILKEVANNLSMLLFITSKSGWKSKRISEINKFKRLLDRIENDRGFSEDSLHNIEKALGFSIAVDIARAKNMC